MGEDERKRGETLMTIEEAREILKRVEIAKPIKFEDYADMREALNMAIKALEIELLTDKEQRIFLKAMSREREVCQKVDDEYSDDESNVSLVKVCNSIERKVKKIWE